MLLTAAPLTRSHAANTLIDVAAGNLEFSTLVTAVQSAGLVERLRGPGPFTVFAPNDAAFAKLPAGTVEALLQEPNRLRHILLYHVTHGPRLRSTDLKAGLISTMHSAPAKIALGGGVKINQATVIAADVEALNGVIHVLDEVILPSAGFDALNVAGSVKGGAVTLVWPVVNGAIQVLEATATLNPPAWEPVEAQTTTNDGVTKTVFENTGGRQFFRIHSAAP